MCNHLTETQLIFYLDGHAPNWIADHIVGCCSCRNRVYELENTQNRFRHKANPELCPTEIELGEYALNSLETNTAMRIHWHVQDCAHCRQRLAKLTHFVDTNTSTRHILYPAMVGHHVTAAVALRTGNAPTQDDLTFVISEAEINLVVRNSQNPASSGSILGLITGIDVTATQVAELRADADDTSITTPVSTLGDFAFDDITPGQYEIIIRGTSVDYILRGIAV